MSSTCWFVRPCALILPFVLCGAVRAEEPSPGEDAPPEFGAVTEWINSEPLKLQELRGKVVVVHFWASGCVNCKRNLRFYQRWHDRYSSRGATVIGVHTPETNVEADVELVRRRVKENSMTYAVAVDSHGKSFKAWRTRYWPSIFLVDKKGVIRYRWHGELSRNGTAGDEVLRQKIEELLAEK